MKGSWKTTASGVAGLLVILLAAVASVSGQDAAPVAATAAASGLFDGLISAVTGKFGWLVQIISVVGALRVAIKPIMTAIHSFAESTATTRDDALLAKVESSGAWKAFTFALDWVASIKLKK